MGGPPAAVAAVRTAVRRAVELHRDVDLVVACSGGADSVALAAAVAAEVPASSAVVVDHGLQPGSAAQARATVELLDKIGLPGCVVTVQVERAGGMEAGARRARYAALRDARPSPDALVLLGHTLDDQAETVLLGLGRGSGPRSIAGMRPLDPPWLRPLLAVRRATTRQACAELGLPVWDDPHNTDPRFTRARLRHEVLPLLEDVLAGGVAAALARTAAQLREDSDALDAIAAAAYAGVIASAGTPPSSDQPPSSTRRDLHVGAGLPVEALVELPAAVRRRVLRSWLADSGVRELSDAQLRAADDLVGRWRGQGGPALPGGLELVREHGRLLLRPARPGRPPTD
ncbi:MAG: tRNA(Ile)-lysidine synthase [Pseudonocardia sp.]|nr:tRNA(Ile)-lysidine synthase [Pseudonocardia sp.]